MESLEDQQQAELTDEEARRQLEVELSSLRRELANVRKELAAKVGAAAQNIFHGVLCVAVGCRHRQGPPQALVAVPTQGLD